MSDTTQVVAQWLITSDSDFDEFIDAEETLIATAAGKYDVDGHDIGSGTFNVFMYTRDPEAAVALIRELDQVRALLAGVRVGVAQYTNKDRTDWTFRPAYPEDLSTFELVYAS